MHACVPSVVTVVASSQSVLFQCAHTYVHVTHVTVAGVVVEVRSFRVCAYMYVCNSG